MESCGKRAPAACRTGYRVVLTAVALSALLASKLKAKQAITLGEGVHVNTLAATLKEGVLQVDSIIALLQ
jgi:hypothetical protein